mmetsp:Transcript_11390/g.21673  ORF Transcript_11390/g.21673 Transcript_11390/m.21673 type:complete len:96 (+) Transcript_11390:430-717(+)
MMLEIWQRKVNVADDDWRNKKKDLNLALEHLARTGNLKPPKVKRCPYQRHSLLHHPQWHHERIVRKRQGDCQSPVILFGLVLYSMAWNPSISAPK